MMAHVYTCGADFFFPLTHSTLVEFHTAFKWFYGIYNVALSS